MPRSSAPRARRRRLLRAAFAGTLVAAAGAALLATGGTREARAAGTGPDEARVELGRRLFFDPAVSRSGENACAQCHDAEHAFSSAAKNDVDDFTTAGRHSQTLLDAGDGHAFHWDGEFDTVEELVTSRLGVPSGRAAGYGAPPTSQQPPTRVTVRDDDGERRVIDLTRLRPVADRVEADGRYGELFQAAFGSRAVTAARLAESIGAFVRTIRSTPSAYDRHAAGDREALSPSALRGLALFRGRAGCARCHLIEGPHAPFTDRQFHNTGVTARSLTRPETRSRAPAGDAPGDADAEPRGPDRGHGRLTSVPTDDGTFKTPTLRDVARRPPYMHDASFETLEEVVRHYAQGATKNPNLDAKVRPFEASPGDVEDLVAFLRSLTGETRSAVAPDWRGRVRATRVRILDEAGRPLAGLDVRATPAGDRLPGDAPGDAAPRGLATDAEGWLSFVPAHRTHMLLELPCGLRPPQGGMVPDTCARLEWRLPVTGRAELLLVLSARDDAPERLFADVGREAGGPVDLRAPAAVEKPVMLSLARTRPVFVRDGEVDVAGFKALRYRAWVGTETPRSGTVRIPRGGGSAVREVELRPGAVTRVDLTGR